MVGDVRIWHVAADELRGLAHHRHVIRAEISPSRTEAQADRAVALVDGVGPVRELNLHRVAGAAALHQTSSRTSVSLPVTAAAAAIAGLTRCVRAPGPWRPTKLRLL